MAWGKEPTSNLRWGQEISYINGLMKISTTGGTSRHRIRLILPGSTTCLDHLSRMLGRWQLESMKVGIWLRRVLPILAIVGLMAGPFIAPMNGVAMAAASDIPMSEMMTDMPCCPQEKPANPDCQKTCPLMATCMAKCFSVAPTLTNLVIIFWVQNDTIRPRSDATGDARSIEPPARPPRT